MGGAERGGLHIGVESIVPPPWFEILVFLGFVRLFPVAKWFVYWLLISWMK